MGSWDVGAQNLRFLNVNLLAQDFVLRRRGRSPGSGRGTCNVEKRSKERVKRIMTCRNKISGELKVLYSYVYPMTRGRDSH